jgi:5-amino-6-(5-phospho-D-ribitylamino)uracil phosphatase
METVYVSDLDGTLLCSDTTLSSFSRDTLNGLIDAGLKFTVASARSTASMRPILDGLRLTLPVVEFNGAFVRDLATGQHAAIHSLPPGVLSVVRATVDASGCLPFLSTFDGSTDRLYCLEPENDGMQWYVNDRVKNRDPRLVMVSNLDDGARDQVVCITVVDRLRKVEALRESLEEELGEALEMHVIENTHSPGWHWLMIQDREATKDRGVRSLMKTTGLGGCELVVFGDQTNDLRMFQAADRAYATENAVDELKSAATSVIGTCDDDSVARFIQGERAGSGRRTSA